MIGILDYGAGNIKSVENAVKRLHYDCVLVQDVEAMKACGSLILPGVGAFSQAMVSLQPLVVGLMAEVLDHRKPLLGICLGMQMLYETSYEGGRYSGLGFLEGEVIPIPMDMDLKVPHMGWNQLHKNRPDPLTKGIAEGDQVYFVHSYYLSPTDCDDVVYDTDYGVQIPALIRRDNIVGMQFHPEKSGEVGMRLLQNFLELAP